MSDLFKLVASGEYSWSAGGIRLTQDDPFVFVSDEEKVNYLSDLDVIERVGESTLEDALDGDADDVIDSIQYGEWDDILDYLLYAERERESRSRVCLALVQRSEALQRKRGDGDSTVAAADLTVGR